MRIYIIVACLVASSLAQGSGGGNDPDNKLGPVLCALDELELPDDGDLDLSFLVDPLKTIAGALKDFLDDLNKIAEPDDPTLKKALSSIVNSLKDIISNVESALSEIEDNSKSLKSVSGLLQSIIRDVITLFNAFERVVVNGLGLASSGSKGASKFVLEVSKIVQGVLRSLLSNLADGAGSLPVLGPIFEGLNSYLLPIVDRVVSIINGALGVSLPFDLGLGSLTSQVVGVLDNLLSGAIQPLVKSILPSGSSGCGSSKGKLPQPKINIGGSAGLNLGSLFGGNDGEGLGDASSPSPVVSLPAKVINMLGSLVSSPTSMNIDDLLSSISTAGVTPPMPGAGDTQSKTKVIRPSPETICIPMKDANPTTAQALNSSLGMPLLSIAVQLSAGMPNQQADLGKVLDSLVPLVTLLGSQIEILKNAPVGELGSGLLAPVLQILESLYATLTGKGPIDAQEVASRLLRALDLFIGFTAVSGRGNPAVTQVLLTLLQSLGPRILEVLAEVGLPENQLQAQVKTIKAIGDSVGKRSQGSGAQSGKTEGGRGGLLNVVGDLLNAVVG